MVFNERLRSVESNRETPKQSERTKTGLHTFESLKCLLEKQGFDGNLDKKTMVQGLDKKVYAVRYEKEDGSQGWITLNANADNQQVSYVDSVSRAVVAKLVEVWDMQEAYLQGVSSEVKVVKSRPMRLYPELFGLEYEDVWPGKGRDVAVIGDPFQKCDAPGITIIEYEYASEIVPKSYLEAVLIPEQANKPSDYLKGLTYENVRALGRVAGFETPDFANPYEAFVNHCFSACDEIQEAYIGGEFDLEQVDQKLQELRKDYELFTTGEWTMDDGKRILELDDQDKAIASILIKERKRNEEFSQEDARGIYDGKIESIREFFEYKQRILDGLGNPEAWQEFLQRWIVYTDRLLEEALEQRIPNYRKKREQVDYWLNLLPTLRSQERVVHGLLYLQGFYDDVFIATRDLPKAPTIYSEDTYGESGKIEIRPVGDDKYVLSEENWDSHVAAWKEYLLYVDELSVAAQFKERIEKAKEYIADDDHTITLQEKSDFFDVLQVDIRKAGVHTREDFYDSEIFEAKSNSLMGDGAFGAYVPGNVLGIRAKRFLGDSVKRVEQAKEYFGKLAQNFEAELQRFEDLGIPLDDDTKSAYLAEMEHGWAKSEFFEKDTRHASVLHGFFPYDMPAIDLQDRIVALTSVSMHGWNNMEASGFQRDIEMAIEYLKVGGKYILGPINQEVYFGRPDSDFDAEGLTQVLQSLASEGKVSYRFIKGKKEEGHAHAEFRKDGSEQWDQDNQVLRTNESAKSLVITRLK